MSFSPLAPSTVVTSSNPTRYCPIPMPPEGTHFVMSAGLEMDSAPWPPWVDLWKPLGKRAPRTIGNHVVGERCSKTGAILVYSG